MKKGIVILLCMASIGLCACGGASNNQAPEQTTEQTVEQTEQTTEEITVAADTENAESAGTETATEGTIEETDDTQEAAGVSESNKAIITEAMGITEDSKQMEVILWVLGEINAGNIKSAVTGEKNGYNTVDIVAEDNTNYCIYFFTDGVLSGVENVDTGEWPISSEE